MSRFFNESVLGGAETAVSTTFNDSFDSFGRNRALQALTMTVLTVLTTGSSLENSRKEQKTHVIHGSFPER